MLFTNMATAADSFGHVKKRTKLSCGFHHTSVSCSPSQMPASISLSPARAVCGYKCWR